MRFLSKWLGKSGAAYEGKKEALPAEPVHAARRSPEPWFWDHYDGVPRTLCSLVPEECLGRGRRILDFGCGDGATTLGMATQVDAEVIGVDLYQTYMHLPDSKERNLGSRELPANLSFAQTELGEPLPFADASLDLIYSWSVFEHVADVKGVLRDMNRAARPGATLFIQIEPLFFGPFGSHLHRLVDEPWAHLLHSEEAFLRIAAAASDHVPPDEQDTLYRTHSFESVKTHLLAEYESLNKITASELALDVLDSGFDIGTVKLIMAEGVVPPPRLSAEYPLELLLTNQVVLIASKPGSIEVR